MTSEPRPAAVYRLWDADENLLYMGSAYNPKERAKAHRRTEWGTTLPADPNGGDGPWDSPGERRAEPIGVTMGAEVFAHAHR
ncbi:hypothetical protein ABT255_03055 [Streptomyces mirabilis]|uniref:hypothetical protein n=1 Tax=Streptomyces mirabilis TaxID=68239 RepID=UPI003327A1C9